MMAWFVLGLLLLGLMLVGLATGLHQQWLVIDWLKLTDDLGLPAPDEASSWVPPLPPASLLFPDLVSPGPLLG